LLKAIVFLGNPGRKYVTTRHNAAWLFCDQWLLSENLSWSNKFKGKTAAMHGSGNSLKILKPETFMNLSGQSVTSMMDYNKIKSSELLVIHDSLETPFGSWFFKSGGGTSGHNGLKSIRDCLKTSNFYRIGIGIAQKRISDKASFVLKPFNRLEQNCLDDIFTDMRNHLNQWLNEAPLPRSTEKYKVVETE